MKRLAGITFWISGSAVVGSYMCAMAYVLNHVPVLLVLPWVAAWLVFGWSAIRRDMP